MHIVIVGGGAIGRLFGYYLIQAGHQITIIDRDPAVVSALNTRGIEFLNIGETNPDAGTTVVVRAETEAERADRCDFVLLTVKSAATANAAKPVAHLVSAGTPLLSLQAGLGNIETLQKILPPGNVLAGFTYMSGATLSHGKIRHGSLGTTYIGEPDGSVSPRLERIHQVLQNAGIETRAVNDIQARLWSKVIIHSAINPVSAILRVSNGCLIEQEESRRLMRRLIDEGCAVARACNVDLVYPDFWQELMKICKHSARGISPMLQDILNERATEIDAQNGALCRYGYQHGVAVDTHELMVDLVKLLEHWTPGAEMRC